MISLSHLLEPWLLPPGINFLIILFGIVIRLLFRRTGRFIILVGFISLWLLSTPIVSYKLLDVLQNQYPVLEILPGTSNKTSSGVIIVLGGGDTTQKEYGNKRTVSDYTLHRVNYAAYLHQQTHLPILVSGGKDSPGSQSEADLMADVLKENFGIDAKFKEGSSENTADESLLIAPLLKQHNIDYAYLVTDAWHMPRSMYIFHCKGIPVTAAPMGYIVTGPGYSILSFFPNVQALYASSIAFHEYIGLLWYYFRYHTTCIKTTLKT